MRRILQSCAAMIKPSIRTWMLIAVAAMAIDCGNDRQTAGPPTAGPAPAPPARDASRRAARMGGPVSNHVVTASPSRSAEVARAAFGNLPLAIVENRGQDDPRVQYSARGGGYGFYVTPRGSVVSLLKDGSRTEGATVALRFPGQNPHTRLVAEDRAPGEVNYLRGNDPAGFRTGVSRYSTVVYRDLWPHIDL